MTIAGPDSVTADASTRIVTIENPSYDTTKGIPDTHFIRVDPNNNPKEGEKQSEGALPPNEGLGAQCSTSQGSVTGTAHLNWRSNPVSIHVKFNVVTKKWAPIEVSAEGGVNVTYNWKAISTSCDATRSWNIVPRLEQTRYRRKKPSGTWEKDPEVTPNPNIVSVQN
jgi:hypothetical protein